MLPLLLFKMNDDINMIKGRVQNITTPLLEEKELLEKNIKEFTEYKVAEFKEKKTKDFTFGQVGFRKSTSIITRNVKAIIEALKNTAIQYGCIQSLDMMNEVDQVLICEVMVDKFKDFLPDQIKNKMNMTQVG